MSHQALRDRLAAMAATPGIDGCALVEIEAGMVWHACGCMADAPMLATAACDYWRLYGRLSHHFSQLGELGGSVMFHTRGRLTLLPCGKGMLLVAVSGHQQPVDWLAWQDRVRDLARLVDPR